MDYSRYEHLLFDRLPSGVLKITFNRPDVLNAINARLHSDLGRIWRDLEDDPETRVVLITGSGRAFSAGGDVFAQKFGEYAQVARVYKEARDLVYNMVNFNKPVVTAINGWAVGVGLAVALLADVSIASTEAKLMDGHTRIGVAAGDHAAIIWPLLCGMARAKYYLLTSDPVSGEEAARMGLVSLCVSPDELLPRATEIADRLARGSSAALRSTKYALNSWLRLAGPIFDTSLGLEMLDFFGPDVAEGAASAQEKRAARFPSAQ